MIRRLKHVSMLWIHAGCFARRNGKEGCIEGTQVGSDKVPPSYVDLSELVTIMLYHNPGIMHTDPCRVKDESSKRSASSRAYLLGLSSGSSRIGGTGTGAGLSKIPSSSTWSARQGLYADTITDIEHETGLAAAEQYRLENVRAVHVKTSLDVSYGGVS
jgi:hypothetical protein